MGPAIHWQLQVLPDRLNDAGFALVGLYANIHVVCKTKIVRLQNPQSLSI